MLWQVTAPHFCAGIITKDGVIVHAAPILRWCIGKRILEFGDYCNSKRWSIEYVDQDQ